MTESDQLSITIPKLHRLETSEPLYKTLPKIKTVDWKSSFSPMVHAMVSINEIQNGSVLLVTTMKNNTNGNLQTNEATSILIQLLKNSVSNKFQLCDSDRLNMACQILGISADNGLELLNNVVSLARYLDIQYVLYSIASGNVQYPYVNLQILLVNTGEIIWSMTSKSIF
ncbi:penicillin-binding protein activator LpoB [Candidatus Curculioniphilus buchneri]|uniref:penicillin-binding protein activator LpoB n=1 Tax=Candidatus Curculioniphilus buchneri TaxID=690594 RepID=UPI00376EF106